MTTGPTYTISNPTPGQEYIAPVAYQVVPNAGSQIKCNVESFDADGNTISVTSITAINRDVTTNTDKSSYTYNNGYGANTITSNTNGSDVFAPAGKVGSACAQLRMWLTYTGHTVDQPPNAPSSLTPSGLVTTLTPTLSANFSDPTSGDTLAAYEIQATNAAGGGGSQVWDSGTITASGSEIAAAAATRAYGTGGGTATALAWGQTYSWRARMQNNNGNWGAWSSWVNFNTVQGPNAPASVTPAGLQSALGPAFSFVYSSPASTAMQSYHYQILDAVTNALIYDSGTITHSATSGSTITGTISSADGQQYGHAYDFNIFATDTNGAASPTASSDFTIAALPQVAPVTPAGGATVNVQTPTLLWSYSDPNYAQAQAQVEIQNAATDTDILLTSWLAQSATQYTCATPIPFGTQIRWRVQVQDSAGLGSGWSAWAYATVNNTPQATITSPTPNQALATMTPTITWTYTPSGGGQPQASANIAILDANGNTLASYTLSGTGASYTIPLGVLLNSMSYNVQVSVTDTASSTGVSSLTPFSVALPPPADMQGQPLANGKNWLLGALLVTDANQDGVADGWSTFVDTGSVATFTLDPNITQPVQEASGDGPLAGAQKIALTASTTAGKIAAIVQNIPVATPGWTPSSTALSVVANAIVSIPSGSTARAYLILRFLNSGGGTISAVGGPFQADSSGALVRLLGPQNQVIPASTATVQVELALYPQAGGDTGTAWFLDAQLEAAAASDANVIEGSLGTGYSYDSNGYSVRSQLAGGLPAVRANPGADGDPLTASGGTVVVSWDTSLADPRFTGYLIERRRVDQQADDTAWTTLATLTNPAQNSWTDYAPGSNTTYQYSVRQTISYGAGQTGISAHRAIVIGSVSFSPAWYLSNVAANGQVLNNVRLAVLSAKRTLAWKESAKYSQFLGRVGSARDAGQPQGYTYALVCYFDDAFGDDRQAVRRQFVAMQRLNALWLLKDPRGLVVPVWLQDIQFDEQDTDSDTLLTATLNLLQAQDTDDY